MSAVSEFGQIPVLLPRRSLPFLVVVVLAGLLAGLTACSSDAPPAAADFGSGAVGGFAGAVAADEPRAVLVARDVLSGGGSAADAAVAAYFTMAVSPPSPAGIRGC